MKARIAAPIVALITLFYAVSALAQDWKPLIAPDELVGLSGKVDLIDIRQVTGGAGYDAGHIDGAVSAPYPLWRGPPVGR